MIVARFDGGCWPNPNGHSSCACLIEEDGKEIYRESKYLGTGDGLTCNVAECEGLKLILTWLMRLEKKPGSMRIIGDSRLVISRMNRKTRKGPYGRYYELARECQELILKIPTELTFRWEPREMNGECDSMCDFEIEEGKARAVESLDRWKCIP